MGFITADAIYNIKGEHLLNMLHEAGLAGARAVQQHLKETADTWISEEEAKKLLDCGNSKLYHLRLNDEIIFTEGYKKKYLQSSIYAYLKKNSNS